MLLTKLKAMLGVVAMLAAAAIGWRLCFADVRAAQTVPAHQPGRAAVRAAARQQPRQAPATLKFDGPVDVVAYSPDGRYLATQHRIDEVEAGRRWRGHEVKLWDRQGKALRTLTKVHTNWFGTLAFSDDGKALATVVMRRENNQRVYDVKLWNPQSGDERATLVGATHGLYALAFSPDGKQLAAAGSIISPQGRVQGGEIYLWDIPTGNLLWQKQEHSDQLYALAFSPDGKMIASGGGDKVIKLWDAKTGAVKQNLAGHDAPGVSSLAFSRDGALLASGGSDGKVRLWRMPDGKLLHTLGEFDPGGIVAVAFGRDKRLIAGGSAKSAGVVKWIDPGSGEVNATCRDNLGLVRSIALSADGHTAAIGSWDQSVKFWELPRR